MIVKNEAHVIERCLYSVKPMIDYALIVDTGSTDKTVLRSRNWLSSNGIPGEVLEHDWQDFATNRSLAIECIRPQNIDYVLMIDADEVIQFDGPCDIAGFKRQLRDDVYYVLVKTGGEEFLRPQ
ncbi:MAG TPA: glycosyltransferase, partial [Candidatus Obscuribacterales bacterium]